jgi:GTP-binding protein
MADIPGLIEGAHQGKGLGDQFLQHIERTKVLAYLVSVEAEDPQAVYDQLRQEVWAFDQILAQRPHIAVITKSDLLGPDSTSPNLEAPEAAGIVSISSVAHQGLDALKERLWDLLTQNELHDPEVVPLP